MGNNSYYKFGQVPINRRDNAPKAANVNNIEKWTCDAYQIKPDSDKNREGGCNKVNGLVGTKLDISLLPGMSKDVGKNENSLYDYVKHVYTYQKTCAQYDASLCEGNTVKTNTNTDGAGNDTANLVLIKDACNGHRYPNIDKFGSKNSIQLKDLYGTKIVSIHDFMRLFILEYKERIKHNMYKNADEIIKQTKTLSDLYYDLRKYLLQNTINTDSTTIFIANDPEVRTAKANIMKLITAIVKAMDKGTSYYNDQTGEKITANLSESLNANTLITANNKNNQGLKVLDALYNLTNDCICYSDCTGYSVCFCYGNCNHY